MTFQRVTAIAVMSDTVYGGERARPRAAAIAVVKLIATQQRYTASFHSHVPDSTTTLLPWLDAHLADGSLLVGHRLLRTSRLLCAAGYDRRLRSCVGPDGWVDLRVRGAPSSSLAVLAALSGIAAVDEKALLHVSGPIDRSMLASLALANAAATAVIWAAYEAANQNERRLLSAVISSMARTLSEGPAPIAVATILARTVH